MSARTTILAAAAALFLLAGTAHAEEGACFAGGKPIACPSSSPAQEQPSALEKAWAACRRHLVSPGQPYHFVDELREQCERIENMIVAHAKGESGDAEIIEKGLESQGGAQ